MSTVIPTSLRFSIEAPAKVRVGETVSITLRLENAGARPLDLYLRGRTITFDVVVARADRRAAWQRLAGSIVPAIVQHVPLEGGEVLVLRTEWDQRGNDGMPVGPGLYTAQGFLPTDAPDPLATDPVQLHITVS